MPPVCPSYLEVGMALKGAAELVQPDAVRLVAGADGLLVQQSHNAFGSAFNQVADDLEEGGRGVRQRERDAGRGNRENRRKGAEAGQVQRGRRLLVGWWMDCPSAITAGGVLSPPHSTLLLK